MSAANQVLVLGFLALPVFGGLGLVASAGRWRGRRQTAERLQQIAPRATGTTGLRGGARELPTGLPAWLRTMLFRADYVPDTGAILLLVAVALVLGGMLGWRVNWLVGFAGALLALAAGPLALRVLAARRIGVLVDAMPFFIDSIRQMLMAGTSLQQALVRVSGNAEPGLHRYLQPMVRRIQNGASVGDSLAWLADRLDLAEMHMVAAAVQANIHYGGRLSTVLGNLATTLRDRARIIRELRAATAETRVSAMLLGALPVTSGVLMSIANPRYADFFLGNPTGHHLLAVALGLQLAGLLAIRRLMRLDF